jgi:hypothetical protein|tara:strand:- start:8127 stop:8273 length:147 start_codon:yes stop_codon:yes gene_type:complete
MIEQLQNDLLGAGLPLDKVNEIVNKVNKEIEQIIGKILMKENKFVNRY